LTRRQTLEITQPEKKPLLQPKEEEQLRHSLLPPQLSRKSSIRKDASKVSHEVHIPGQCTFGQAVLNGNYTDNCFFNAKYKMNTNESNYSEAILSEE